MKSRFALTALSAFLLVSLSLAAEAETNVIKIGKLTYIGTGTNGVSQYEVSLNTTGVTAEPITFRDAVLIIKGTRVSSARKLASPSLLAIAILPAQLPSSATLKTWGGPGFPLAACASLLGKQNCVSIALQLISRTGANFSFMLVNGEEFCTYAINTSYVTVKPGNAALDPECNVFNFCKGASAPILLRRAPKC
jgi:hypothetical protein